jgi:hypothetical protein
VLGDTEEILNGKCRIQTHGRGSKGKRRRSNTPIIEGNGGEKAEIWTEHERLLKSWRGTP